VVFTCPVKVDGRLYSTHSFRKLIGPVAMGAELL
jgi:hypothetical protein